MMKPWPVVAIVLVAFCLVAAFIAGCSSSQTATVPTESSAGSADSNDEVLAQAYADRAHDLMVEGQGVVVRLLADDTEGARHQRFIVELSSGQTLLVVHNIDVAPRVDPLEVGDPVGFKGEYVWNQEGGLIHWTHHDPDGFHQAGWIEHDGHIYD